MPDYVKGLLIRNEPGAKAPGAQRPVDRWLVIQTIENMTIRVFDYTYLSDKGILLSEQEGIEEGKTYTFLLKVLADNVENVKETTLPLQGEFVWQGTIVHSHWVLPSQEYLTVNPQDIGSYHGVLVQTDVGQVIINHDLIGDGEHPVMLRQNDVLRWDQIRFSLLAILKPV